MANEDRSDEFFAEERITRKAFVLNFCEWDELAQTVVQAFFHSSRFTEAKSKTKSYLSVAERLTRFLRRENRRLREVLRLMPARGPTGFELITQLRSLVHDIDNSEETVEQAMYLLQQDYDCRWLNLATKALTDIRTSFRKGKIICAGGIDLSEVDANSKAVAHMFHTGSSLGFTLVAEGGQINQECDAHAFISCYGHEFTTAVENAVQFIFRFLAKPNQLGSAEEALFINLQVNPLERSKLFFVWKMVDANVTADEIAPTIRPFKGRFSIDSDDEGHNTLTLALVLPLHEK